MAYFINIQLHRKIIINSDLWDIMSVELFRKFHEYCNLPKCHSEKFKNSISISKNEKSRLE